MTASHWSFAPFFADNDDELRSLVAAQTALIARLEERCNASARFAEDAAHELRTPLAVLGGELELALRRPRSVAEWVAAGQRMRSELARMNRLVEALLAIARADDGRAGGAACDPTAVLAETVGRYSSIAKRRGLVLLLGAADAGAALQVQASADAVDVVVSNLVANAVRYTPEGGIVRASAERAAAWVVTHVDDSGAGIPPDERDAIFGCFVRGRAGHAADARDPEGPPGLGLGLSIVRRIVDRHGGSISVTRSPYGGARFSVAWPPSSPGPC